MIWFGFGGLSIIIVALFMIRGRMSDAAANPVALYKKQLADLIQDEEAGILEPDAATAARLEIERRILKIKTDTTPLNKVGGLSVQMALAALVILSAAGVYYFVGTPTLPAAPGQMVGLQDTLVEEGGLSFREAIERIEKHLAENPTDQKGWEVLAKSARSVGSYSKAAIAFGKLASLDPDEPAWRAQELEAYIGMGAGQVSAAAKLVLMKLLQVAPEHPAGHYYLGLARKQAGDEAGAKEVWTALAGRSVPNAPWMPLLTAKLAELGVNPPPLSEGQVSAVANMTEEERDVFVRSMIVRLEERLDSAPNDPEGWLMLARSKLTIEGKAAAITALETGLQVVSPENTGEMKAFLDNLQSNPDL